MNFIKNNHVIVDIYFVTTFFGSVPALLNFDKININKIVMIGPVFNDYQNYYRNRINK